MVGRLVRPPSPLTNKLNTGCRRDDPTFRLRLLPLSHAMICSMISHLGLEDDVTVWTQADTKDREREPKTLRSSL